MRLVVKIMSLLLLLAAVLACESPVSSVKPVHTETGLSNQIRINGLGYTLSVIPVTIYSSEGYRWLYLYFLDGGTPCSLRLAFNNQEDEIPLGTWTILRENEFENVNCVIPSGSSIFNWQVSSNSYSIDIKISGITGGVITIDGTFTFDNTNCVFNYSGPYVYTPS